MADEEIFQAGWNLAMSLLQEIGALMQGASHNYINSNYLKAFSYLRAIRMRMAEISKEEHEQLTALENRFALLSYISQGKGFTYTEESNKAQYEIYKLYGEYNDMIMSALKKYGYLVPQKEDRTNLNR